MQLISDFLGSVNTQLGRSELAYDGYLKSGKMFLYAKILKDSNDSLRDLLISKTHLLPAEHAANSLALIHHIDVWSSIWDYNFALHRPSLGSVFSFDNEVRFPHKEVALLLDFYETNFVSNRAPMS